MISAVSLTIGLLLVLTALAGPRIRSTDRSALLTFVLSPVTPASWDATGAILLGFLIAVIAFPTFAALLSSGASLLIVGVGFVILGVGVEICRVIARSERRRARFADPRPLRPHAYRQAYGNGPRNLALAIFLDPSRWRDALYVVVSFPLTVLEFIVTVGLWSAAIVLVSMPVWFAIPESPNGLGWPVGLGAPAAVAGGIAGLFLTMVAATAAQGIMTLHRAVVSGLLCVSDAQELAQRVETLQVSRRTVIDQEATELRRIERDLHDGAQQRLVMLSIDLSLAADRIESDPDAARTLVVEARDQARQALGELRDLVRGIAPAILLDRGLVPALSAIAGRCPVPTVVASTLPDGERFSDATERAAYFVVAEALANVAKHSSATHCEIRCRREGSRLVVEVCDDGAGGAQIVPGGGLAGLQGRVEALDGTLQVSSPEGGPTTLHAELPAPVASMWGAAAGIASVPPMPPGPPTPRMPPPGWPGRS